MEFHRHIGLKRFVWILFEWLCITGTLAQQESLVFSNQITGKTSGIPTKQIESTDYIALTDLLQFMDWELDMDYAEGLVRANFRDMEFRFADGVSGYYRSGEFFETASTFVLEKETLWAPIQLIQEMLIPAWEGDLVWDPSRSELKLMHSPDVVDRSDEKRIETTQPIIVIDAGHGGEDPGFTLTNGKLEKELTRKLAEKTSRLLADRMGADVILTRNGDFLLSDIERVTIANRARCDLFISIHLVASTEISPRGFMLYTAMPRKDESGNPSRLISWGCVDARTLEVSRRYASAFGEALAAASGGVLWQELPMNIKVLEGLVSPAFLVELGLSLAFFGDVAIDRDDGLNRAAEALYDGIQRALETGDRSGT